MALRKLGVDPPDLVFREVSRRYGKRKILRNLSFTVPGGALVGIVGPNGAGKTTMLRILAGLVEPNAGEIQIGKQALSENRYAIMRKIGYLPEGAPLVPDLRVNEYLRFRAQSRNIPKSQRNDAILHSLEQVGATAVQRRIIGQLSKGLRQRVGLAAALLGRPRLLILDEPLAGLDPDHLVDMRQTLSDLIPSSTVVLSSHLLTEVARLCTHIFVLQQGEVIAQGPPTDLQRNSNRGDRNPDAHPNALISLTIAQRRDASASDIESLEKKLCALNEVHSFTARKCFYSDNDDGIRLCFEITLQVESLSPAQEGDLLEIVAEIILKANWRLRELRGGLQSIESAYAWATSIETKLDR